MRPALRASFAVLATLTTLAGLTGPSPAAAAETPRPNLAPTPPMGWNSWNTFNCNINEQLIRDAADALVTSGMAAAGYQYVNIDDCWAEKDRDPATGRYVPSHERFPSGIKALADYVHGKGLKLGIYTSAGTLTCANTMPGSLGHEETDAKTFAEWGVDYLKYDNCNNQGVPAEQRYKAMGDALAKAGRPIVYSLCEWGSNKPWLWGASVGGHLWRTTDDINASWPSVMSILDQQVGLEAYSGPNAWNDPDMLEVGNPGLTQAESRAHLSLWALLNAPLIAGNDIRSMTAWTRAALTNRDIIAVDQDWGGRQGTKIRDDGDTEVWAKPMSDGSAAVVLLNRAAAPRTVATTAADLGLGGSTKGYTIKDLWSKATSVSAGVVRAQVGAHDAVMFRVTPGAVNGVPPSVMVEAAPSTPYVHGADPVDVEVTVHNDGLSPINSARLALVAPPGWTAAPLGSTLVSSIKPGGSGTATWRLSADGPDLGPVDLSASASWLWHNRVYDGRSTARFTVVQLPPPGTDALSDLTWLSTENGWGPVEKDQSNGETAAGDGHPLTIAGTVFPKGLGTHAPSSVQYYLGARCTTFTVTAGIDDEVGDKGRARFDLVGDGSTLATTEATGSGPAVPLSASVAGVNVLELRTADVDGTNSDHTDWGAPVVTCS
ncbi:MAG TPA: NPCBM/NEW2 domain-containing protein [Kribbella sp.]